MKSKSRVVRMAVLACLLPLALLLAGCWWNLTPPSTGIVFSPAAGTYTSAVSLSISYHDAAATIYVTTDGTLPTNASTLYQPGATTITIYSDATIRAAAYVGTIMEAEGTAAYVISGAGAITAQLEGTYTNTTGSNPSLSIDASTVPSWVGLPEVTAATGPGAGEVTMTLNNVNIYKDGHNYYLQDVVAEEYIDGAWHHDTEFSQAKCQLLSKLGVVLILDRSQSLGTDFALVKTYAKSFVDVVVTNSPYTPIGIVDFSTDVQTRAPATDYTSIKSYIDGLTQAQYTSYYAAIRAGMNMFTTVPRISGYLPYVFTLKPTLTWAPSTGEYEVQASTSSDVSAPFVWESGITSSAYTFATSLTDGTPYYWRNKPSGGSWTPPGTFVPSEAEGLAIVSFTDGADNMADPGTYDALLADLKAGTVKSFTIGLTGKGDLDTTKLQALAVGGSYALASSAAALQGIFDEFSLAVSNAYRVTYTRTNQLITSPRKVRFTLSASLDRSGGTVPQTGVVISSNSEGFEQSTSLPAGWTGSWGVDTSTASGGTHSLRSGAIGANSYSSVQLTRTMAAGGNVSFDYKVSSEGGFDNLCFYVDGVQHGSSWSGEVGWTSASFGVGAGTHIFKWTYSKDANTSSGSDAAWIDDVVIR